MAVRSGDALICPACQTRNRASWEFCVRCAESLQGVTLSMVSLPGLGDDAEPLAELEGTGGGGVVVLGFLALAAVSGAACWYVREGPAPKQPSPDIFTLATLPPSPAPPPTPVPEKPGAKDFEEGRRLLAGGDAAKAIPFLSRAVGVAPGNALFHDVLGQALAATGAQDQAFAQFGEAARVDRARFGRSLAERLAGRGRDQGAAPAHEQVLAGTPDHPFAQEGLGRLQYRLGNYPPAAPPLHRAVKTPAHHPRPPPDPCPPLQTPPHHHTPPHP